MLIRGKRFEVPKAYPKGIEGRLVNDQQFIDDLNKYLVKDISDTCARNSNLRTKPNTKSNLIHKCVFADSL